MRHKLRIIAPMDASAADANLEIREPLERDGADRRLRDLPPLGQLAHGEKRRAGKELRLVRGYAVVGRQALGPSRFDHFASLVRCGGLTAPVRCMLLASFATP
jgi:hypothetical protein